MTGLFTFIAVIFILIPLLLFGGFIWMIGLGILASIFDAPNLAISFWHSVLVSVVCGVLLGGLGSAGRNG